MASIFTKIIAGELPSYTIAEDEDHMAFLDVNPNTKGHTLCVPKQETDKIFDLNEAEYMRLMKFVWKVAKAIEKSVPCNRVGIAVVGLEVPHVHVHLIPMTRTEDMTFQHKVVFTAEEMDAVARHIRKYID